MFSEHGKSVSVITKNLLGIKVRYSVFIPDEILEFSRNRYPLALLKFRNTFPGFLERVRMRSVEHTQTDQEIKI